MNDSTHHLPWRTLLVVVLIGLLIAAVAWRVTAATGERSAGAHGATPKLATRSIGDAELELPSTWQTLQRAQEHATWGDTDHAHTVTVAGTDIGDASLATIVRDVARAASSLAPGTHLVGSPEARDIERAPRGDSAMLLRLQVDQPSGPPLEVVQVWRRDTRAGRDLVATWTSSDGAWPADPARQLPGSRLR